MQELAPAPGPNDLNPAYHVRCWAWWNATFAADTFLVRGALPTTTSPAIANVYLGHMRVGGWVGSRGGGGPGPGKWAAPTVLGQLGVCV